MNQKIVILGTAHGKNVAGKRSPDGKFEEYSYSREIVGLLRKELSALGFIVHVDMMQSEVPLPQTAELRARCKYVNELCEKYGTKNCIYVSIHVNAAASTGRWNKAGGWSAYTSRGNTSADKLADCLYESAKVHLASYAKAMDEGKECGSYDKKQRPYRTDYSDGDADQEAGFYVLTNTKCAAVLTENLFMDNKSDVRFLTSEKGKSAIVKTHVEGILKYLGEHDD